MRATEQEAREQSGFHQAPSLSHRVGRAGRRAGGQGGPGWLSLFSGLGVGYRKQCKQKSPRGWDRHRAGTGTGAWQVPTGSWQSAFKAQELQQGPNPNGRRSFPPMPCSLPPLPCPLPPLPCSLAPTGRLCHSLYPGLSLAAAEPPWV